MNEEAVMLEAINSMVLEVFTKQELKEKGIKETNFKWIFNSKNKNIIPVLELYKKGKVYRTIESIEFPEIFQILLEETQKMHDYNYYTEDFISQRELLRYLEEEESDCSECDLKEICPFSEDKD